MADEWIYGESVVFVESGMRQSENWRDSEPHWKHERLIKEALAATDLMGEDLDDSKKQKSGIEKRRQL